MTLAPGLTFEAGPGHDSLALGGDRPERRRVHCRAGAGAGWAAEGGGDGSVRTATRGWRGAPTRAQPNALAPLGVRRCVGGGREGGRDAIQTRGREVGVPDQVKGGTEGFGSATEAGEVHPWEDGGKGACEGVGGPPKCCISGGGAKRTSWPIPPRSHHKEGGVRCGLVLEGPHPRNYVPESPSRAGSGSSG